MDQEIWRPCRRLPEYIVSSHGRVMRIPFYGEMPHGGEKVYGGVPIDGVEGDAGRRHIVYRGKTYRIHKLVCEAFHGPRPFADAVVMHLDENAANNRADNLRWGTQKENMNAPGFLRYCRGRTGENSPWVKGRKKVA